MLELVDASAGTNARRECSSFFSDLHKAGQSTPVTIAHRRYPSRGRGIRWDETCSANGVLVHSKKQQRKQIVQGRMVGIGLGLDYFARDMGPQFSRGASW